MVGTVPSPDKAAPKKHGIDWPGVVGILAIQLAVLLALSCAVIFYLDWSSNAALAEFMVTTKSSASGLNNPGQPPIAIQQVKGKTTCFKRV
jgi:hypothetical protein